MANWWRKDEDANVWRLVVVSQIQRHWLRRIALVATLPFMFLWWVVSLFIPPLGFAVTVVVYAALIVVYPLWHMFRSFPVELFRSVARRWNVPMERDP